MALRTWRRSVEVTYLEQMTTTPNKSLEPTASTPFSFPHRRMLQLCILRPSRLPEAVAQLWR